jgi:hypothetical protein
VSASLGRSGFRPSSWAAFPGPQFQDNAIQANRSAMANGGLFGQDVAGEKDLWGNVAQTSQIFCAVGLRSSSYRL